jgi:ABC-type tungstate transport system permease subunit
MAHRGANDEKGHFMTDSSSWVAGKKNVPNLEVLFKGDKFLVNTYHALDQPESTTPGVSWATKFTDFIASDKGQRTKGAITGDVSETVSEIAAIITEKTIHACPLRKRESWLE